MKIIKNVSLKTLNTIGIGGNVKELILIESLKDFELLNNDYFIIGNGSNIVFTDDFYDNKIIKLSNKYNYIKNIDENNSVFEIGASTLSKSVINYLIKRGITGFEWSAGIPATIGGMIYNNAGAYNNTVSDRLIKVVTYDIKNKKLKEYYKDDLYFGYRTSTFKIKNSKRNLSKKNILLKENISEIKQTNVKELKAGASEEIILKGYFKFNYSDSNTVKNTVKELFGNRVRSQPLNFKSAGSVFINSNGFFIAKILDELLLKGFYSKSKQLMFSNVHSNFIVNCGNASFSDFDFLVNYAKEVVFKNYGFYPVLEVEVINEKKFI